jgi:phosphoribosyl 1,2-cyclic phosphodiesterase/CheY-like chemotaxis protein
MKTVLVIDDDADLRQVLCLLLRHQGWRVFEAANGQLGIDLARQHLPQAILCDLLMPGVNGFRVCSAIRSERALRHCLVVAMSGRGFDDNRRSALDAGADEFLVKPFDPAHMLALLERLTALPPTRMVRPDTSHDSSECFLKFWGVRGSIPVPGPGTVRYGGNTACVEFRGGGEIVILDAGTGLRALGDSLAAEFTANPPPVTLLITHAHWDHVQGFPFFKPAYDPAWHLRVLGFESAGESLASVFARQMEAPYFPIKLDQLPAHPQFEELGGMDFALGPIAVQAAFVNHPGVCVGYRLTVEGVRVVFIPDHEPFHRTRQLSERNAPAAKEAEEFARREDERTLDFARGADVLILDSQFDAKTYETRVGWGHSSVEDAVEFAARARVKRLVLFHHDPGHDDDRMDQLVESARTLAAEYDHGVEVEAAREGMTIALRTAVRP